MGGASIETTLELWPSSLRDMKARIRPLFGQERVAASAGLFLDGLSGNEPRKTGWMRAEARAVPVRGGNRRSWAGGVGARCLARMVRDYALEMLADEDAVLVIDETGFLKQGKASCGVARQYTGSAGKITNCQIGVFASYVSRHGHAFIDGRFICRGDGRTLAHALRRRMCQRLWALRRSPNRAPDDCARDRGQGAVLFVAADSVYGTGDIETVLRKAGKGYVLGVASNHVFHSWGKNQLIGRTPRRLRTIFPKTPGGAYRQAKEPKVRACMTGPISNWPISMRSNTTAPSRGSGRGVC